MSEANQTRGSVEAKRGFGEGHLKPAASVYEGGSERTISVCELFSDENGCSTTEGEG